MFSSFISLIIAVYRTSISHLQVKLCWTKCDSHPRQVDNSHPERTISLNQSNSSSTYESALTSSLIRDIHLLEYIKSCDAVYRRRCRGFVAAEATQPTFDRQRKQEDKWRTLYTSPCTLSSDRRACEAHRRRVKGAEEGREGRKAGTSYSDQTRRASSSTSCRRRIYGDSVAAGRQAIPEVRKGNWERSTQALRIDGLGLEEYAHPTCPTAATYCATRASGGGQDCRVVPAFI